MKRPKRAGKVLEDVDRTKRLEADSLPIMTVNFSDEFAPSFFEYFAPPNESTPSPLARHFFYNAQIVNTLYFAIEEAIKLGFPSVGVDPNALFVSLSSAKFQQIADAGRTICPTLTEGSKEWLCVQCYLRWASACWHFTEPDSLKEIVHQGVVRRSEWQTEAELEFWQRSVLAMGYSNDMLHLGAACRELELSILNREVATARRKQIKRLAHQNEGRDVANAERRRAAEQWQVKAREIASETDLEGMARARWVKVRLLRQCGIDRHVKTVWAAIK